MSDDYNKIIIYVLVFGLIYCIIKMCESYIINNKLVSLDFKAYHMPYIPKIANINDDEKIARHLKFRFLYTCSEKIYVSLTELNNYNPNIQKLFEYYNKNKKYVCFFVINNISLYVADHMISKFKTYPYKMYDTYVMGETRIFDDIQDILYCQGKDRDAYGTNCISTTFLNEICSNKMEYITYFMKHGLMVETWIKPYNTDPSKNIYNGFYVKAPYSSRSVCAAYEKVGDKCFLEDGVIVQEKNNMLGKYEIKCYVLDGKIEMVIVRLGGKNKNICVPDDYYGTPKEIKDIVQKYRHEMEKVCQKAYDAINALIDMRIGKLNHDNKEIEQILNDLEDSDIILSSDEQNKIKYTLNGLVNSEKIKMIDELNAKYNKNYDYESLIKTINQYPDPIELGTDYKRYDRFMRIDMALPDDYKYNTITVTEIEPFASGIYMYKTIGACMKNDDLNNFDNITKYNLYKIITTLEK